MSLNNPLIMILPGLLAGLVQGITGFGSGIILMIFLPALVPIGRAAGISTLTMFVATVLVAWRYRKSLQWRRLVLPFIIYSAVATYSVHLGKILDTNLLRMLLGGLLVLLSIYFTVHKGREAKPYPVVVNVLFMIISGFFNGLFGIGGPLMALYYLMMAKTKEEYLASIQTFFVMDGIYVTTLRFSQGILRLGDMRIVVLGMIGALVGTAVANRLVTRMNTERVKQIVYLFIGVSGLYYLIF